MTQQFPIKLSRRIFFIVWTDLQCIIWQANQGSPSRDGHYSNILVQKDSISTRDRSQCADLQSLWCKINFEFPNSVSLKHTSSDKAFTWMNRGSSHWGRGAGIDIQPSPKSQPCGRRLNQLVSFSLATQENREMILMKFLNHFRCPKPRGRRDSRKRRRWLQKLKESISPRQMTVKTRQN